MTISAVDPSALSEAVPEEAPAAERDALWFAYGLGATRTPRAGAAGPLLGREEGDIAPSSPDPYTHGSRTTLPYGTTEWLERAPYGTSRVPDAPVADALGHALVAAFGVQRREPENPYNDHRGYASARSKFPVHAFLRGGGRRQFLDVNRHSLVDLAGSGADGAPAQILLAGRYTRLPDLYEWLRGSLVNLELGINLRALSVALELFGVDGGLRLPGTASEAALADLGLEPTWEWSLPIAVDLAPMPTDTALPLPPATSGHAPDAVLAEVVSMNRVQDFPDESVPLGPAVPELSGDRSLSWAELFFQRSAGREPRGLYGMSCRRTHLPAESVEDAVRWLAVPPPGPVLGGLHEAVTTTAVLQSVRGHEDGIYRMIDDELTLVARDSSVPDRLQEQYGYPSSPWAACDIRDANALWFFSVPIRDAMKSSGAGAWSVAQYIAGWRAHGLSLAAAGSGVRARPTRAFSEAATQRVLGLGDQQMILLAVIVGAPRHLGTAVLDLRL